MTREDVASVGGSADHISLATPNISLHGEVNDAMLSRWLELTLPLRGGGAGPVILELSTVGAMQRSADASRTMIAGIL